LDRFHFPSADWFDYSTIKEQCQRLGEEFVICFGTPGDMDFINSIGRARGSEKVLMDLVDRHPVYLELLNARFKFYYEMHERALQAGEGLIDIAQVGEDLGTQIGPMISHDIFEELFAQKYEAYFAMAHRYGAKTMIYVRLRRVFFAELDRSWTGYFRRGAADYPCYGHRRAGEKVRQQIDFLRQCLRPNHPGLWQA